MVCTLEVSVATFANNKCCVFILFPLGNIFCVIWLNGTRVLSVHLCMCVYKYIPTIYPQAKI